MIRPPVPTALNADHIAPLIAQFVGYVDEKFIASLIGDYNRSKRFSASTTEFHPFTKGLVDWYKLTDNKGSVTKELIYFATQALYIMIFHNEWKDLPQRKEFLDRLYDKNNCKNLLLELRVGVHFLNARYPVSLVFNDGSEGKKLDLKVHTEACVVGVECRRRKNKVLRWESRDALIEDLLQAVEEKAASGYDYKVPRLVWIQIPETLPFLDDEFREELGSRLFGRFDKENKYSSISSVIFSPDDTVTEIALPNNSAVYSTKNTILWYPNLKAKYDLAKICPNFRVLMN